MRTFSLATLTLMLSLFIAVQAGFAQEPARGFAGYCPYGCGPYLPLITTPSISLETVSPNPVGARNATAGLVAGATDSTLSEESGNTSSVYTMPVWYSGGGMPLVAPAVNSPVGTMRTGNARAQSGNAGLDLLRFRRAGHALSGSSQRRNRRQTCEAHLHKRRRAEGKRKERLRSLRQQDGKDPVAATSSPHLPEAPLLAGAKWGIRTGSQSFRLVFFSPSCFSLPVTF